jgi:hypothetical protein
VLTAACGWLLLAATAVAADGPKVTWSVGWDSIVKQGRWAVATAEFTLAEPQECRLEVVAPDADGHEAIYLGPLAKLPAGNHRLETPFQAGRAESFVMLRLKSDAGHSQHRFRGDPKDGDVSLIPMSERLIVSLGDVGSLTALSKAALRTPARVVVRTDIAALPETTAAYAGVDWLVLTGSAAMPEPQSAAIRDWVRDGGRLLVSIPKSIDDFRQSPLMAWLPFRLGDEPVAVRDLGALEAFAGITLRIPMAGRVLIAGIEAPDGVPIASNRNDKLVTRVPYGFGEVVVVALDITQPPLANWGGMNDFTRRLVELELAPNDDKAAAANVRGQLTSTGISDLASQLGACLDHFPAITRASPWWSMVWLLGSLLVVGPIDYLLVHRLLKRPHLTWVTLPVWLILFAGMAASAGSRWNQSAARLNQLDVVDIDVATNAIRAKSYATYYSPSSQRVEVAVEPRMQARPIAPQSRGLNWFYIPESTTGGLYRPGGAERGRTEYEIEPLAARMTSLPVLQWSTRTAASQWAETWPDLVKADLQSTGLGRLVGTIQHQLPGPLTDWVLAYGNRAYWLQESREDDRIAPLAAGRTLSTADSLVFQGDLRSLLTRIVITREAGETANDIRIVREETRYDVSLRDPHRLWQVITFHKVAGGKNYTGLANDGLPGDDLSRELELGRAVLFGRMDAATWLETKINGAALEPDRRDVFVRLVLPVRRSGEFVRELPKFEKDEK